MAAQLQPIATELEEQQFLLQCERRSPGEPPEVLTGLVKGFALAMMRAKRLAATGWRVRIDASDPDAWDEPRITVEPRV